MGKPSSLGDFELLVSLALVRFGEHAYGMLVRGAIEERTGRVFSLGAFYATLDRLDTYKLVRSTVGGAGAERRGRAKRFFAVEPSGREALARALRAIDSMRSGVAGLETGEEESS